MLLTEPRSFTNSNLDWFTISTVAYYAAYKYTVQSAIFYLNILLINNKHLKCICRALHIVA